MKRLTKRQLDRIAKIYAGSILSMIDGDFCELPESELDHIQKSVISRGKKIVGTDPTFATFDDIIKYVIKN